ncbi:MAG: NBR1-Ig-like domain-containing protein [Anaerolineales bacterium]
MNFHFSKAYYGFVIMFSILFLSSCNLPASSLPTEQKEVAAPTMTSEAVQILLMTQIAGTLVPPTATIPPSPTMTALATNTVSPTETPTPTIPTPRADICTDKAEFVKDVSLSVNSVVSPSQTITKTWRIRNSGTCAWTPQYALVFVGGDNLDAPKEIPFTTYVDPGNLIDLSVSFTTPDKDGSYQAQWMIRSADASRFGIGKNYDQPLLIKFIVSKTAADLNLGSPTWSDTFKNSANWYLLETNYTKFVIKNNQLVMKATPGGGDEWGISNQKAISDFYMEVNFVTGEQCSGKDRYGLLFRAPNPNAGYVFGFSCDGMYRFYKWDGAHYMALQEWKASDAIHQGANQSNRLAVWAKGNLIKIYANGTLLGEFTDSTYSKGQFGLFIGAVNSDPLFVYVEDISYWLLGE